MDDVLRVDEDDRGVWLGERHYPWATVRREDWTLGFVVDEDDEEVTLAVPPDKPHIRKRGAHWPMENGLTVSAVWGNYTASTNTPKLEGDVPFCEEPGLVEVAVMRIPDDDGPADWIELSGWDGYPVRTLGYVSIPQLRALIEVVAQAPSDVDALDLDWSEW